MLFSSCECVWRYACLVRRRTGYAHPVFGATRYVLQCATVRRATARPSLDTETCREVAMPYFKNITGLRFGRLVALRPKTSDRHGKKRWVCACDCGKRSTAVAGDLLSGKTKSCGCRMGVRHGLYNTPIYVLWWNMRSRCFNPRNPEYKNYGGRGITICGRWLSFVAFHTDILAEIGERPRGKSFDRINNDGNYEPGNVRWATPSQQTKNQRRHQNSCQAPYKTRSAATT